MIHFLIDIDFDQPKVVVIVASMLGDKFTRQCIIEAIQSRTDWNHANVVKKLIGYCVDLQTNHELIKKLISSAWDKTITANAFKGSWEQK